MRKLKNFFLSTYFITAPVVAIAGLLLKNELKEEPKKYDVNQNIEQIINTNPKEHGFEYEKTISYEEIKKPETLEQKLRNAGVNKYEVMREIETKQIPVLMFHNIHEKENRYTVSPKNFKEILTRLYEKDFYLVTLDEFTKADFAHIPVGKKPILLTFDDASTGQFMYDKKGEICKNSAVGILNEFCEEKDFGKGSVFFISFGTKNNFQLPFNQDEHVTEKLRYLVENSYDIGYHTHNHPDNSRATKNNIKEQKITVKALLHHYLGDKYFEMLNEKTTSYAHPFGATPGNTEVYDYQKQEYSVMFRAWGGYSSHPLSKKFDEKTIPRRETTLHNLDHVLRANTYQITENSKKYYEILHNKQQKQHELTENTICNNKNHDEINPLIRSNVLIKNQEPTFLHQKLPKNEQNLSISGVKRYGFEEK